MVFCFSLNCYTTGMRLSNTQIQSGIAELPENIKRAVMTFDWAGEVMEIGRRHALSIEDIDIFRQQTLAVILGKSPASHYADELSKELSIKKDLADMLVDEANAGIFRPLQKHAFTKQVPDLHEEEIIHHDDLTSSLKEEGIELVDDSFNSAVSTDLHKEVHALLNDDREISDHNELQEEPLEIPKSKVEISKPTEPAKTQYQEEIKSHDLKGISAHRSDTSILTQSQPMDIFNGRDFGQGSISQAIPTLEKKILEDNHIPKVEKIDASADTGNQTISSENYFDKLHAEDTQ